MKVAERYSASLKKGVWYVAEITCADPTGTMESWFLFIRRVYADGRSEAVFNGDFDSLYHAKNAMKNWKKGLNWVTIRGQK